MTTFRPRSARPVLAAALLLLPAMVSALAVTPTAAPVEEATSVAVVGVGQGEHAEKGGWGLSQVEAAIRRHGPDAVLAEIPPDRWEGLWSDWTERGVIEAEGTSTLPGFTGMLLPLAGELGFEVVPCGASAPGDGASLALIEVALEARRGERLMLTCGAGHTERLAGALASREDVELVDVAPYLPARGAVADEHLRAEIEGLHVFFEGWLNGTLPSGARAFSRADRALGPAFTLVNPWGQRVARDALMAWLQGAHASMGEAPLRIWIRNVNSRDLGGERVLATYEEWQERPGDERPSGRLSTVLMRRDEAASHGLVWEHVHETWITGWEG